MPARDECTVATDRTDIKWDEDDHCEVYLALDRISGASRVAQYTPFAREVIRRHPQFHRLRPHAHWPRTAHGTAYKWCLGLASIDLGVVPATWTKTVHSRGWLGDAAQATTKGLTAKPTSN